MKLYIEAIKLLFNKFILGKNTGIVIKEFSERMGIVYIKLAQMLATQNYGNLFTEEDRRMLSSICDDSKSISYDKIENILKREYGERLNDIFESIEHEPIGSASVSQVHKAILKNGEEVVIKVKREDITSRIEEDIEQIRKLMYRFGRFIKFGNFSGGNHALDLYIDWIHQEIDFKHEIENIKAYQNFANSVNGKVYGTKTIKVPKVYEEYLTDNVIVMEYIKTPTINKMELTSDNKSKIMEALNSYIKSSFYALLNDKQVVFHGDPHSGNISIDDNGNICFLDMGLLCVLSEKDAQLTKRLFLTAYSGEYDKLYDLLIDFGRLDDKQKQTLKNFCKKYCEDVKTKDVTHYFVDVINACLVCEINPPDFLFSMAKAFVCLNGISGFADNKLTAKELLQEQVVEFMIKRSLNDCKGLVIDSLRIAPKVLEGTMKYGLVRTMAKTVNDEKLRSDTMKSLENLREMLLLLKASLDYDTDKEQFEGQRRML